MDMHQTDYCCRLKIHHGDGNNRNKKKDKVKWLYLIVFYFRTYSDPSLHQPVMPTLVTHYHAQLDNEDNSLYLSLSLLVLLFKFI